MLTECLEPHPINRLYKLYLRGGETRSDGERGRKKERDEIGRKRERGERERERGEREREREERERERERERVTDVERDWKREREWG